MKAGWIQIQNITVQVARQNVHFATCLKRILKLNRNFAKNRNRVITLLNLLLFQADLEH